MQRRKLSPRLPYIIRRHLRRFNLAIAISLVLYFKPCRAEGIGDEAGESKITWDAITGLSCNPNYVERTTPYVEHNPALLDCHPNCVPDFSMEPIAYIKEGSVMNPFSHIDVGSGASVAMGDFDYDGDFDLVVGTETGGHVWYDNVGNATYPEFRYRRSKDSPIQKTGGAGSFSTWAAGDVDGDGDMDIYLVGSNGNPWYFENNSTSRLRNGEIDFEYLFFERIFGSSNAMNIPDFNNGVPRQVRASVEQADLDGDGDADLILAWADGEVGVFKNVGKREDRRYMLQCRCKTKQMAPMMLQQDILEYFPHYVNPLISPESQKSKPLRDDNYVVRVKDLDNDGNLEMLVLHGGKIKVYDDPLDYRSPSQTYEILQEYDLGSLNSHFELADVNGDGWLDVIVGNQFGQLRYFEKSGYQCTPCPPGSHVPPPPALPICTPCEKGWWNDKWNQTECNLGKPGVQVISPSARPSECTTGTIGYYEGAIRCYPCPGGAKSCVGGDVCGSGRIDPSTLCIKCEKNKFKAMGDSCEPCGAGNLVESAFGFGGLLLASFIGYRIIHEVEGYFFLVGVFDFVQLFLLLTSLGLTLSSQGGVYIVTVTSSSLLHPDFLHLECWLPWVTFEHKYVAFLAILVGFILGAEALWGKVNVRSRKLKKAFFNEKKVWDDLKEGGIDEEKGTSGEKRSDLNPQEDFSDSESDDFSEDEEDDSDGSTQLPPSFLPSPPVTIQSVTQLQAKAKMQLSFLSLRSHRRLVIFACTVVQVPFIHYGLKLFSCTPIDEEGGTVLSLDPRVSCQHPSYLLFTSLTTVILPVFILGPPFFTLKTNVDLFMAKIELTSKATETWGVFYEHCKLHAISFWEPIRSLRRTLMATLISVDSVVFKMVGDGAAAVSNKSSWVFLLNAAYLVLLLLVRPYKSMLCTVLDFGLTTLFILASLNNIASVDDQTGVYLLAISGWIFLGAMAFAFYSKRKLMKKKWRKEGIGIEKEWLDKLEPFNNQLLHPTSRKLLDNFISLSALVTVASSMGNYEKARRLHCKLTMIQADLIRSLEKGSGLRDFISKQFTTNEDALRKALSSATEFYKEKLSGLKHESDILNFEEYLRHCLKIHDYSQAFERTLIQVRDASEKSHDFVLTADSLNELSLFINNTQVGDIEKWQRKVIDIVEAFEVGNFDHFMRLENKLLGRISDKRKREEAKQLSRQRVRELLLKKCDATCRLIERAFCSNAHRANRKDRVRQVYEYLKVWCEDAQGFGLPEDVEERLINDDAPKREIKDMRKGSAFGALFGTPGAAVHPNGSGGVGGGEEDPFAIFQKKLKEKEDGLVSPKEIDNRVKEEVLVVRRKIKELSNRKPEDIDPMEVFGAVKQSKEKLDEWLDASLEALWKYELKSLLRGDPVRVKQYQRIQMDCFGARFSFIKAAQKAMDEGKDLLISDDWRSMRVN